MQAVLSLVVNTAVLVMVSSKDNGTGLKKYRKSDDDAIQQGNVIAQIENNVVRENLRIVGLDFAKVQKTPSLP
jgi:hypothetical protein